MRGTIRFVELRAKNGVGSLKRERKTPEKRTIDGTRWKQRGTVEREEDEKVSGGEAVRGMEKEK